MRLRIYQAGLSGAGAVEGRIRLFCIKMSGGFVCQGCHPGVKQPGRLNQPRSTFSPLERRIAFSGTHGHLARGCISQSPWWSGGRGLWYVSGSDVCNFCSLA